MKRECGKIYETDEYERFRMSPCNRPIGPRPMMEESMEEIGFMASRAIHVTSPDHTGVHTIISGHHRFVTAKRLGIPIKYIVDDLCDDVYALEYSSKQTWSGKDWFDAQCAAGDPEVLKAREFMIKHDVAWSIACSLLRGHTTSSNMARDIASGEYKVTHPDDALEVVMIAEKLERLGVRGAKKTSFIYALAQCMMTNGFKPDVLLDRVEANPGNIRKGSTVELNIHAIGEAYNFAAKSNRLEPFFETVKKAALERKSGC